MRNKNLLVVLILFIYNSLSFAQDIQSGIKMMRDHKYSEAKSFFTSLLNSDKRSVASYYLGSIYFLEDEVDLAETFFESK